MVNLYLLIGGFVFVGMGLVHGVASIVDVFRPTWFTPVDDAVRSAMKSTRVRFLRARANVWDAWLGFNISHSLGMLLFGAAAVWLGLHPELAGASAAFFVLPVVGLLYFILSLRFWFYAPAIASLAATACFAAAWVWR